MRTYNIVSNSEEETLELGKNFARILTPGDVIALDGDLGAGKTVFTRGFSSEVGVTSHVCSPTFTIVNEYLGGTYPVYHFDTYRLEGPDDFLDSGLDEYFYNEGVCIIEWSSIIEELLPENTIHLKIRGVGDTRSIEITYDEQAFDLDKLSKLDNLCSARG